jgi:hypothetical protein
MDDAIARSYGMNTHPSLRFGHDDLMLDDDTVDRLIDGLAADDAPPAYEWVAEAMAVLRAPAVDSAMDAEAEDLALALFRAARDEVAVIDPPAVRRPAGLRGRARHRSTVGMSGRARRVGVVAGAVAGLSLVTATSAAAMTGALPAPAQRAAHAVMSVVGVDVPKPAPRVPPAPAALVVPPGIDVPPASAPPFTSHPGASINASSASAGHGSRSDSGQQPAPTVAATSAPGAQNGGPSQGSHGHGNGQPGQSGSQQGQGGSGQQGQSGSQQGQGGSGQAGQGQQDQSGGGSSGPHGHSSGHGHAPH